MACQILLLLLASRGTSITSVDSGPSGILVVASGPRIMML
jgi:hypothetical protein